MVEVQGAVGQLVEASARNFHQLRLSRHPCPEAGILSDGAEDRGIGHALVKVDQGSSQNRPRIIGMGAGNRIGQRLAARQAQRKFATVDQLAAGFFAVVRGVGHSRIFRNAINT